MYTTGDFLEAHDWIIDFRSNLPCHQAKVWRRRRWQDLRGMVWHQTLSSSSCQAVADYHVGPNHISQQGLPGISYTFFVEPDGDTLLCNDIEDVTYSQGDRTRPGDENRLYMAVCFSGNFGAPGYVGSDTVTAEQLHSGLRLWLACRQEFGWSGRQLYGHYHFGKPTCPGVDLSNVIDTVQDSDSGSYDLDTIEGRQTALRDAGHYNGLVDGLWGMGSRRALASYQRAKNLVVDGIWGPETEQSFRDA